MGSTILTYREIAEKYSISNNRAQQLYNKVREYKEEYDSYPPLKKLLSTRMKDALVRYFNGEHIFNNPEIIINEVKMSDLKKVQNIGQISRQELVDALITLGYLKQDDNWLKE
jgi:hypothetical protein